VGAVHGRARSSRAARPRTDGSADR
jgi:hypothetical protein